MKTTNIIFISTCMLLFLSSFSSCEKENLNELPAETQSGKNTLGCMIGNELFLGGYFPITGAIPLGAAYKRETKKISIYAYGKINNKAAGIIALNIDHQKIDSLQKIQIGYYSKLSSASECFQYSVINDGEINLTKFDTINKIISGKFNFKGKCSDELFHFSGNDSTQITQGRFDIQLRIYDN